jgi:hypothetical protein
MKEKECPTRNNPSLQAVRYLVALEGSIQERAEAGKL